MIAKELATEYLLTIEDDDTFVVLVNLLTEDVVHNTILDRLGILDSRSRTFWRVGTILRRMESPSRWKTAFLAA